jgi:hypothetical protein
MNSVINVCMSGAWIHKEPHKLIAWVDCIPDQLLKMCEAAR